MSEKDEIDPAGTYVLDDEELAELDDIGLTGVMKGLSEYFDESEPDGSEESE